MPNAANPRAGLHIEQCFAYALHTLQVRERLLFEDMDRASWFSAAGVSGLEVWMGATEGRSKVSGHTVLTAYNEVDMMLVYVHNHMIYKHIHSICQQYNQLYLLYIVYCNFMCMLICSCLYLYILILLLIHSHTIPRLCDWFRPDWTYLLNFRFILSFVACA